MITARGNSSGLLGKAPFCSAKPKCDWPAGRLNATFLISVSNRLSARSKDGFGKIEARRACLPAHLRLEDNPADVGLRPEKQNHFRLTGQVVMMDRDWECFRNDYNDRVAQLQGEDLTHGPCSLSGSAA